MMGCGSAHQPDVPDDEPWLNAIILNVIDRILCPDSVMALSAMEMLFNFEGNGKKPIDLRERYPSRSA